MPKKKPHILMIEDDPDISRAVAFSIRKEGHTVEVINDGQAGLNAVLAKAPDLLILDLMLPNVPGEEICKSIRENDDERIQRIPIIMLTAKGSEVDGIVGRVIGANSYIAKPFVMQDLLREIDRLTPAENAA
ncbi:MAG TPA: response regulator [Verrucomicrobiae bacterium]|jgi:two-component system response regulator RegX3|nr:response regulator [Verrucomicrobiae bacterium]